jgi:tetratricopeptide (TPR) repeat protein
LSRNALDEARAQFDAGDFRSSRRAALEGLESRPNDPDLLRIAGRAGVELGADDAADQLRAVAEQRPDEAEAWRDLGDALAAEGRMDEAAEAFRKVVELDPEDEAALTALGHAAYVTGSGADAVSYLEQAAGRSTGASSAMISLVDMYREMGQPDEALAAAEKIAAAAPEDTSAVLDVADLSLELGRLDGALRAFERLRELDELPDHEVYALHGMVAVELRREGLERALELAREAAAIDRHGRTAGVLAYLEAQVSGAEGDEPPPSRDEVDAALSASLAEHRRMHAEDRRIEGEDLLG